MHRSVALCAGLLSACSVPGPATVLPPPFGPDPAKPEAARFFFPTGVAIAGTDPAAQWLVVSNANSDRLYDAGAMYSLRAADLLKYFPPGSPAGTVAFPTASLVGKAMTGNFTGPVVIAGGTAYAGSRDSNRLNAVAVDANTGALSCRRGATISSGDEDCRDGVIDLSRAVGLEGPYGIVAASNVPRPDGSGRADAVLVSSLVPHITDIASGFFFTSSQLAAVDQANPSLVLFTTTVTDRSKGSGIAAGPIVFDEQTREAIVGGCYSRFGSVSAGGEPSTSKCGSTLGTALLRFVPVDAGASAATRLYDLTSELHSTDIDGMALGTPDPTTGARKLYLTMRFPDSFVRIALPTDPAFGPIVESVTTISSLPSEVIRLQRPAGSTGNDLFAITAVATYEASTTAGKLIIVDGVQGRVVGQVEGLGSIPFAIAQFPPALNDTSAKLAVSVFGSCRVSLVDVPYDRPDHATLRANVGSCPQ